MTTTPSNPPAGRGFMDLVDRILGLVLNKSHRPSPGGQEYWKRAIDAQLGWPDQTPATPSVKPSPGTIKPPPTGELPSLPK